MNDVIEWLRGEGGDDGRLRDYRTMPGRDGTHDPVSLHPRIGEALRDRGIESLYTHQATTIEAIREGENVVLATPTASGKSLTYTIPAIERALDREARTLYIAPMRALINDQLETVRGYAEDVGGDVTVDRYTGQLSTEERRTVRRRQPHMVMMTPDLLHYGVLSNPGLWSWFFRTLETVVIDEVHEYRGVFGNHIALLMRRLARLCERRADEAIPQFVCCSATIGNPGEHAAAVTGRPEHSYTVVTEDTSATGRTHWLFWNPPLLEDDADDADTPDDTDTDPGADGDGDGDAEIEIEGDADAGVETEPGIESGGGATDGGGDLGTNDVDTDTDPDTDTAAAVADGSAGASAGDDGTATADAPTAEADGDTGDGDGRRRSNHAETVDLFCELVRRGHQTLVFTRSRQGAERNAEWSANRLRKSGEREIADGIVAYQAALSNERRAEIETGLHDGSIRGAWSTSALELGVDVGGLDAVIIDGYPGTRMQTHQRAGRAGRGRDESLVILVGGNDQLDQYFMTHPAEFFDGDPESAAVNPDNETILPGHVLCAADETPLRPPDKHHFGSNFFLGIGEGVGSGELAESEDERGTRWTYIGGGSPQHRMSVRSITDRDVSIHDRYADEGLGSLPLDDALRDLHPEALYYHQGAQYEVAELDLDRHVAELERTDTSDYTRALTEKEIAVESDLDGYTLAHHSDVEVRFADVEYREWVEGYQRYSGGESTAHYFDEPLPPTELNTRALYFTVPDAMQTALRTESDAENGFGGAIHAVEHAMISLFPLEFLCDRRDIGGISTPMHSHTGTSTIFIYDGHPGGVGLARGGFDVVDDMLVRTRRLIDGCSCVGGCPACIQSPHCGNANDPLSKPLALSLLSRLLDGPDSGGSG